MPSSPTPSPKGGRHSARPPKSRLVLPVLVLVAVGLVAWTALRPAASPTGSGRSHAAKSPSGPRSPAPVASHRPASPRPVYATPQPIAPVVHPALPAEGEFHQPQHWVPGGSPVRVAWYRSDPANPGTRAWVGWIDPTRIQLGLYPGQLNPPPAPGLPQGPTMVPPSQRSRLLAAFNSGFYLTTPYGSQPGGVSEGFALNGKVYSPMQKGLATFVAYKDGRIDILPWSGGPSPGAGVVFARQNLAMMVNQGKASPLVGDEGLWGEKYHSEPLVWRTGIGIDARGNLLYAAAPYQTPASIAQILVHAGAVRAMQLDINGEWPLFVTYPQPGGGAPRMTFPNLNQFPTVFTTPGKKDFFAVYLRQPGASLGRVPF